MGICHFSTKMGDNLNNNFTSSTLRHWTYKVVSSATNVLLCTMHNIRSDIPNQTSNCIWQAGGELHGSFEQSNIMLNWNSEAFVEVQMHPCPLLIWPCKFDHTQSEKKKVSLFFVFQGDDPSVVQNMAESPVDTDTADVTEVRLHYHSPQSATWSSISVEGKKQIFVEVIITSVRENSINDCSSWILHHKSYDIQLNTELDWI